MTAAVIEQVPIDVTDDLSRAREVVATARSDAHVALIAHTALLTVETLAQQVEQAERALTIERNDWSEWVQNAIDRSREVADEHDWCEVYDNTMERLGFPRRERRVDIEWRATITVSRTVDDDDIERLVRNEVGSYQSIEVTTSAEVRTTITVSGSREGLDGDCICDGIEDEDLDDYLPSWASDWEIEDRGEVSCDNH